LIIDLVYIFFGGLIAGALGVLLGLGGGVFLIPFLVVVVGVPIHQAIATSIVSVIATSSAGTIMNLERHLVNIRLGMLLEMATVTGAILGGITANKLNANLLTKLFAVVLLIIAFFMLYKNIRKDKGKNEIGKEPINLDLVSNYRVDKFGFTMVVSLVAGSLSGLLGIGGGILKVPAMNVLSNIPIKIAIATSNFMIGVTAAASAFIYFAHGNINPYITSSAALGVLCGAVLGVKINRRIENMWIVYLFTIILLITSFQLFLK